MAQKLVEILPPGIQTQTTDKVHTGGKVHRWEKKNRKVFTGGIYPNNNIIFLGFYFHHTHKYTLGTYVDKIITQIYYINLYYFF